MTGPAKTLYTARREFRFVERLGDLFVTRYMTKRARRNLTAGHPPMAVFAFDYIGHEINLHGLFEREELCTLFEFLAPMAKQFKSQVALDIGANIGNHSMFFSDRFAKVVAFEPNPRTFRLLEANAALASNVEVHNYGLGAVSGKLALNFDPSNVGEATLLASISEEQTDTIETVEVQINKLDDIVSDIGPIGFIKIDVEGFEADVLRGAEAFLSANRPVIAFEQNRDAFHDGTSEAIEILKELGYAFCVIEKKNISRGVISSTLSVLMKLTRGIEFEVNLVDEFPPQNYSMIIALDPEQVGKFARN